MTTVDGSNVESFKKELLKTAAQYGRDEAAGRASRLKFAMDVAESAKNGYIDSKDAKPLWERFETARRNASGGEGEKSNQRSESAQTAKLNAFIKAASKFDEVLDDVLKGAIEAFAQREGTKGSTYDALIRVAVSQVKADHVLNESEIEHALFPEKKTKEEEQLLQTLLKQMKRVHDGKGEEGEDAHPSDELKQATVLVEHRLSQIVALRERTAAMETLAKQGITVNDHGVTPQGNTTQEESDVNDAASYVADHEELAA